MANDITYWMNIENDRRQEERNRAMAAETAANLAKQKQREEFTANNANARSTFAPGVANEWFNTRGLPIDQGIIDSVLNQIQANVPDLDPNPNKYYSPEAIGAGIDKVQQGYRDRYGNMVANTFAPGFERNLLPDTAMDPIVASILGDQSKTARQQIDFNKARGLLNDTGYNASLDAFNQQSKAGSSTLSDIAKSILGKERGELLDIRGDAGNAASSWTFGRNAPDIGSFYSRAQQEAAGDLSRFEGSVRSALGDTNLFDVPTLLQKGGTMQGPINLTTAAAPVGLGEDPNKKKNRGLGSAGVF